MKRNILIRNVQAREQLDIFLVSGITSLLLVRYYLYLTGFPQIGNGSLHIAHMLWGGLLMLASIVLLLAFLGRRLQRFAAFIGGAGFGIFIDELGKFITQDNDYFFKPAIGIIYAIFVSLYLLFMYLDRHRTLTNEEIEINALVQLEEAVRRHMDPVEQRRVTALLRQADSRSIVTKRLKSLVDALPANSDIPPNPYERAQAWLHRTYESLWQRREASRFVQAFFVAEVVFFVVVIGLASFTSVDSVLDYFRGSLSYGQVLVIGQLAATVVAAWLAFIGVYRLRYSRLEAFEWFQRSVLVNLLLTEFFLLSRLQFEAMSSFLLNLGLFVLITVSLHEERRKAAK